MDRHKQEFRNATRRMAALRKNSPLAVSAHYDARIDRVVIVLQSGLELAFQPALVEGLEHAKAADLQDAEVSPSGLGVYFPRLDADLSVPGLIQGLTGTASWMAARNANGDPDSAAPHIPPDPSAKEMPGNKP